MCIRCDNAEAELIEFIKSHKHPDRACPVPSAESDYRSTAFYLLACAHSRFTITLDRMEASKQMFDVAEKIPAEVLLEWESHAIAAAELFGRARSRREAVDRADERESKERTS